MTAILPTVRAAVAARRLLLWIALSAIAWAQPPQPEAGNEASCGLHRVTTLPGSHRFAADYIETLAADPNSPNTLYALNADLSSDVPPQNRAVYLSRSTDGGAQWTELARIDSRYFDASLGEGIRNGLAVSPGAHSFVLTTQRGAFELLPQPTSHEPILRPIPGPVVPVTPPRIPIAKHSGDPVRAGAAVLTADGQHLFLGFGYFDLDPKLFLYRRADPNDSASPWIEDRQLTGLPTDLDILSMQFDDPANPAPAYLYVGTGDQVYLFHLRAHRWSLVEGVGPDSAIHGMSVTGGLHLAACWGVYNPTGPGTVRRVTNPSFLIHRSSDEAGNNVRAYSVDVDPAHLNREVISALTGVYVSSDRGEIWSRLNELPDEEFRTAHINPDGSVLVSGIAGTFLTHPFSEACFPQLIPRNK